MYFFIRFANKSESSSFATSRKDLARDCFCYYTWTCKPVARTSSTSCFLSKNVCLPIAPEIRARNLTGNPNPGCDLIHSEREAQIRLVCLSVTCAGWLNFMRLAKRFRFRDETEPLTSRNQNRFPFERFLTFKIHYHLYT